MGLVQFINLNFFSAYTYTLSSTNLQAVPLYLSEMAPAKFRGAINNSFQLSIGMGILIANLMNYGTEKIKDGRGGRI